MPHIRAYRTGRSDYLRVERQPHVALFPERKDHFSLFWLQLLVKGYIFELVRSPKGA